MKAKNIGIKVAIVSSIIVWVLSIVFLCVTTSCSSTKSSGIGHQIAPTIGSTVAKE